MNLSNYKFVYGPRLENVGTATLTKSTTTIPTSATWYLNGTGSYDSMIFQVPWNGIITDVGFFVVTVFSGTSSNYLASLNTMDVATGYGPPSNNNYGGSSGTVFLASTISAGWNWFTLSSPATGTLGDFAATRLYSLGSSAQDHLRMPSIGVSSFPATYRFHSANSIQYYQPYAAIKYSDGKIFGLPIIGYSNIIVTSGTFTNYHGGVFTSPVGFRTYGVVYDFNLLDSTTVITQFSVFLYDDTDTVLASSYVSDNDYLGRGPQLLYFGATEIEKNRTYRIVLKGEAAQSVSMKGINLVTGTIDYKRAFPSGEYWKYTYRTGTSAGSFGSSWVDIDERLPWMGLLCDQIEVVTGTSSTVIIGVTGSTSYYGWA